MNADVDTHYPRALYQSRAFGFLTPFEVMFMESLSRSLPAGATIVNIGAGVGTSGLALTEPHIPGEFNQFPHKTAHVVTIDISLSAPTGGLENERNAFAAVGLDSYIPSQVHNDSKEAGKFWNGGGVNLLFVDGDHSYEGASGDILAWKPHITPGGIIVIHDYESNNWADVKRAVDEYLADWHHILTVDSLIAFRKPEQTSQSKLDV